MQAYCSTAAHAGGDLGSGHDLAARRPSFVERCAVPGGLVDGGAGPGSRRLLAIASPPTTRATSRAPGGCGRGRPRPAGSAGRRYRHGPFGLSSPPPCRRRAGDVGVGPRAFGHRDQSAVGEEPSGARRRRPRRGRPRPSARAVRPPDPSAGRWAARRRRGPGCGDRGWRSRSVTLTACGHRRARRIRVRRRTRSARAPPPRLWATTHTVVPGAAGTSATWNPCSARPNAASTSGRSTEAVAVATGLRRPRRPRP